jgi:class 3 adenylate cyclase
MGTAVFFRVWLYGLNFKASISAKIFIATALACLVPLLSLYALNIVYSSQEELAFRENLKKLLEAKHRYIQSIIDSGISRFRQNTASLGTIIEKKQNFDNDYLQSLFADWCLKNCAMGVIFQKLDQKKFDYVTDEARKDSEFMRLWELKKFFFSSLVEFLLQSPIITSNPEKFSTLLTEGTDNAESVHQILTMNGRLVSLSRIAQSTRLSGILIQDPENENQVPIAYLAIEYSLNKMFDQIFARSFGNFKFADELAEFKIDTAIAQNTDKGYQFAKGCISQNLNRQLALKQISDQSRIKKTIFRQSEQNGKLEYTMISFSPQLPYATYIKASKTSNRTDFFASIYFWVYPILILATALLLAGIFFVSPVTTLTRGLSEIAGGNLSFRLKIETDDEFTKLANEFNAMTKGLIEKEKLEQFVSPDVIEEINRSTEAEMTPGGEKIEASILFSTFAQKQSENTDPNEAVRQLDIFLGICNSICSQNHGVIDKIIGNTIMMVFRGQHTEKPHWLRACETATQIQAAMQPDQRNNSIKCASGISSGTVVSGKIGSKNGKLDFTVIGDTVNMAARLKSMAEKESESCIIVSDKVGNKIKDYWNLIELEPVAIKGKAGKFKTWRISEEI